MMIGRHIQTTRSSFQPVTPSPVIGLQRKCACGGSAGVMNECDDCSNKKLSLQRSAVAPNNGTGDFGEMPPIVSEVPESSGQSLNKDTRDFFERGFKQNFGQVRVHADARAAEAAAAIGARAYTIGSNIVFGAGRYQPDTISGKLLLAHELTHVLQQRPDTPSVPWGINSLTDTSEAAAEKAALSVVAGEQTGTVKQLNHRTIQLSPLSDEASLAWSGGSEQLFKVLRLHSPLKTPDPELEEWMSIYLPANDLWRAKKILEKGPESSWSPEDQQELRDRTQGDVAAGKDVSGVPEQPQQKKAPTVTQHAGNTLKPEEKQAIEKMPKVGSPTTSNVTGKLESRLFVVHDTGSPLTATELETQDKKPRTPKPASKGPTGVGYSVVPRQGDVVMNRASMFEEDRPTATAWEKAEDKMKADVRVNWMHKVWAGLSSAQQTEAIDFVMNKFKLTDKEVKADKQNPKAELDPANKCVPKGEEPCIHTLGQWAVEHACDKKPWEAVATPQPAAGTPEAKAQAAKLADVKTACEALDVVFKLRAERIPFTTNVEVRQVEEPPFPKPFYTEEQYEGVKNLYLKAALEAGAFPHITTHFWVDRELKGHTDPRCFNMHKLYKMIGIAMGHQPGDLYGDEPKYGKKWGVHNVSWDKTDCGSDPPAG